MYTFLSPFSKQDTIAMITEVIDALGGRFSGKAGVWRVKGYFTVRPTKVRFYFLEKDVGLVVRASFRRHRWSSRRFWRSFVKQLIVLNPTVNFGINDNAPYQLAAVVDVVEENEIVTRTRTRGSISGALLGYWAFGSLGAIVGSEVFSRKETVKWLTTRPDRIRAKVLWNDGLVQEITLYRNQPLYQEVMRLYREEITDK